ncbi:MAG: hypothetical protein BWK76_04250 [Desulfobulbaceae bacterium A2]|nr:MAG: hypothetical protein BWK76_04250 [Desulfobulbaceae bacterium A2]
MDWLLDPQIWIALVTLTTLEIVLGVDNIIFIAILAGRLPPEQQARGRTIGLALAMLTRIALLFSISLVMRLTAPLFHLFGHGFSGRDLILLAGGLFLLAKATHEIHNSLEGDEDQRETSSRHATLLNVVSQIMVLDIVFSLDSVITAVGLTDHLPVMVTAIVLAVLVMLFLSGAINSFIEEHPTIKVLALSFLLMVGLALVGEGFALHIPKGYIYFAMAFSICVELLNLRVRRRARPVQLRSARP